jgi:uncharacterized membrane protein (Fun14 family)
MKDLEEKALKMFPKVDMSKITDGNDISGVARFGFIAGYSEAMKEQRKVMELLIEVARDNQLWLSDPEWKIIENVRKHLSSFTEQEQSTKEDNGY